MSARDPMRLKYRELTQAEQDFVRHAKELGQEFHDLCESLGKSRELALALTKIEEAVMWAVKHATKPS